MPRAARYESLKEAVSKLAGSRARATTQAAESTASGLWGLSSARAALPSQNMSAARTTEGLGPASQTKARARSPATPRATKGPAKGAARAAAKAAMMPRCWPESARMCEQPAPRNNSWSS